MNSTEASTHTCRVADIQQLGSHIYRITLETTQNHFPSYFAGQYLEAILQTGQRCCFSIASAPQENQSRLELHIQHIDNNSNSTQLFKELQSGTLQIHLPSGNCFLPKELPETPLLFIAAGTGFAQMKSMIDYCLQLSHPYDLHLYWGARTPADFYLPNLPVQWASKGLHYHPVVSDIVEDEDWCGRYGLLYEAILADKDLLLNAQTYISGSPNMVYATVDVMIDAGFPELSLHSDVFDYSPRK